MPRNRNKNGSRRSSRRSYPRIRRRSKPGAPPGTVHIEPQAERPRMQLMRYSEKGFEVQEVADVDSVPLPREGGEVLWLNVDGLGNAGIIRALGEKFDLHPLALEDVVNTHQQPKLESYDEKLFAVLRMTELGHQLNTEQLSLFLGDNWVLTFQERPGDCLDPVRDRLRRGNGNIRHLGADYLAYAIIDSVVDSYFPVVDRYSDQLALLDNHAWEATSLSSMGELHDIRNELQMMRRIVRPLRDALRMSLAEGNAYFQPSTQVYLRDCYDHTFQLIDLIDTYREVCSDIRELYVSSINLRMTEIMKVLTIIATIFIPLSFVAGLYGMNFDPDKPGNMPELEMPFGYFYALGLMFTIAGGLLFFFWRKGWLSRTIR